MITLIHSWLDTIKTDGRLLTSPRWCTLLRTWLLYDVLALHILANLPSCQFTNAYSLCSYRIYLSLRAWSSILLLAAWSIDAEELAKIDPTDFLFKIIDIAGQPMQTLSELVSIGGCHGSSCSSSLYITIKVLLRKSCPSCSHTSCVE